MRFLPLALAWVLAGCDDPIIGQPPTPPPVCGDETWENFGQSFVRTWCMSCHSTGLPEGYRYNAPINVNFDTYAMFLVWRAPATERATTTGALFDSDVIGQQGMPPAGGVPTDRQERFDAWMACGAPGEGTPVVPTCDGPEISGDRTVASDADATALCAEGTSLTGTLTVSASADLSCLCAVSGDVVITGAAVDVELPALATIGGNLRADAAGLTTLELDEPLEGLRSVGLDVELSNLPALSTLLLGELRDVGRDVLVNDDPALTTLLTPRLLTVGGAFQVERNVALPVMDVPDLFSVGGDFVIDGNSSVEIIGDVYGLDSVGGSLVLRNNDQWMGMVLGSFGKIHTIGGDLVVEGNAGLNKVAGFTELASIGGSLRIVDNDLAGDIDGWDNVTTIGGDLEVSGNANLGSEGAFNLLVSVDGTVIVKDNPKLDSLDGIAGVSTVGGLDLENLALFDDIDNFLGLSAVNGNFTISGLGASMQAITGFTALQTVTGTLEIADNAGVSDLSGLMGLGMVGADLTITGNHALPDAEAQQLGDSIDTVVGTVTITDNGG